MVIKSYTILFIPAEFSGKGRRNNVGDEAAELQQLANLWRRRCEIPQACPTIAAWRRTAGTKRRMGFLADVVENDESLKAVEYAGRHLSSALGVKLKPVAIEALLQAWEDQKSSAP